MLNRLPQDSDVTPEGMVEMGLLRSLKYPIKVLGDGELTVALKVRAHKFTRSAREKIEAAGGRNVDVILAMMTQEVEGRPRLLQAAIGVLSHPRP